MKLLYVSFENAAELSSGVNKKIRNQMKVFRIAGYNVTLIARYDNGIVQEDETSRQIISFGDEGKLSLRKKICAYAADTKGKYDCCYIRFQFFCPYVLRMVRRMHSTINHILMEIPTYPYEAELLQQGIKGIPKLLCDRLYRYPTARYIDRFVVVLRSEPLYHKECIMIKNGVDIDMIKPIYGSRAGDTIHLLAVALMAPWHGYDRLIEGLARYYAAGNTRKIMLHLVGDGAETWRYRQLVEKLQLQDDVLLHGKMSGEALEQMYEHCDIGISVLAGFRKKLARESNLKTVEYCAKGLPVICTANDTAFDSDYPYKCYIPSDETPIDVNKIVQFYDNVYGSESREAVARSIRNHAKYNYDIWVTFSPVITYLNLERENDEK